MKTYTKMSILISVGWVNINPAAELNQKLFRKEGFALRFGSGETKYFYTHEAWIIQFNGKRKIK